MRKNFAKSGKRFLICAGKGVFMDEQEFEAYLAKERQKYEQMIARSIERTDKRGEHLRSVISSFVEETR